MLTKILSRLTQIAYGTVNADISAAPLEPWPDYPHLALREELKRPAKDDMMAQLYPGREV